MNDAIKAAEDALREAKAAEGYRRARETEAEEKKPVVVGNRVYPRLSAVPAKVLNLPDCGESTFRGRCTRPAGHLGSHDTATWNVYVEVSGTRFGVDVRSGHEHGDSDIGFDSYATFTAFWAEVDALVRSEFARAVGGEEQQ